MQYYLEFFVAGLGLVLLLWEAFASPKKKATLALVGAAGLTAAFIALLFTSCSTCNAEVPSWMARFYSNEGYALFFKGFALLSTILVLLMSFDFQQIINKYTSPDGSDANAGEFYCLPIFACAGLMWMASATDLVSIFVSLELVTIAFYVMVAFMRRNVGSLEAGVKYLILGALSTGFLVYGIAWLYGTTGTTNIASMGTPESSTGLLFGLALIIVALGFKVGAAPMQLWIPDVYQGAPTPITAFLSVASKAAGFGVAITILRPFLTSESTQSNVALILVVMAAATLLYGNLAALAQSNFKRLLAYSSIAHAGFLLLGLATGNFSSVLVYLAIYLLMTFAAFYVLGLIRCEDDSDEISALNGLYKRNPLLALALTVIMAAMAGVPLTAGFIGKLYMFAAAIDNVDTVSWFVIAIAFLGAAAGFYYYFKIIKAIYWYEPSKTEAMSIPIITKAALIVLTLALLVLGVYPAPLEALVSTPL
ncbi:NADH-quinone oxidoreductase subunit N [Rubritalea tangerina]|uniref:NADH-quinone oxidoreductase subunit N n=1 Tax=Rubritalea tangerina TaxID=430798 RepID=A0ABW4Z6W5_9BACT